MGTRTPWGTSDYSRKYARGLIFYGTPGHGGYHLSPTVNAKVNEAWRRSSGWYEEDCEWAIVALTFPEHFSEHLEHAKETAKCYYPHQYEAVTGEAVRLEESTVLREERDLTLHAESWIALSAFGDWHQKVPKGMVGVYARKGGDRRFLSPAGERWFLVPAEEYSDPARRCSLGFIVDPARYEEIAPLRG